jgi:xanthine/uracil permease
LLCGNRLPTVASVGPRLSIAAAPERGPSGHLWVGNRGGLIRLVGCFFHEQAVAALFSRVTGIIILMIGTSLMRTGVNWAGGGLSTLTTVVAGVGLAESGPWPTAGLGIGLFILVAILALIRWGSRFIANVAVLLGIVAGRRPGVVGRRNAIRPSSVRHTGRYRDAVALSVSGNFIWCRSSPCGSQWQW